MRSFIKRPLFFAILLLFVIGFGMARLAAAGSEPATAFKAEDLLQTTPLPIDNIPMSDTECLACHADQNMSLPLPSGETVSLAIDRILFRSSVHGRLGYACVQCHTDITGFPHPEQNFQEARDITIYMSQACGNCHEGPLAEYSAGEHAQFQAEGNKESAVCADCHGSHTTEQFSASRTAIPKACQQCHSEIYSIYSESVHGAALFDEFNVDVPTCVDCHGNHGNEGPAVQGFHLFSPQVCARCHADEELMTRYGVNTKVFDTFVADFHGTTVTIFERIAPDQETNKPVCIDCHGVHNIKAPDDVNSTVFKQNLLSTCQRCHPDATPNFPDSWLRHYDPDLQNNTLVFAVDLFYKIFIPATLGIMGLFVVTDFWRNRIRKS
jgi:hypothetical protein